jgi:hypothetical protein
MLWPSNKTFSDQYLQQVLKLGDRYPIDPSLYKLLSFRLCSSGSDFANVFFYNDALVNGGPVSGNTNFLNLLSGCNTYTMDMNQIGYFSGSWNNGQHWGFRLDPSVNSGRTFQLDWVRLTTEDTTNIVPINWSSVTSGTTLNFYLNTSCSTTDATKIGTQPRGGNSSGTFNWGSTIQANGSAGTPYPMPESFQPRQYTAFMRVDSGSAICAASALTIVKAPILEFQKPSMYSGNDYATQVVGDPWGMDNSQDFNSTANISSFDFNGGITMRLLRPSIRSYFSCHRRSIQANIDMQPSVTSKMAFRISVKAGLSVFLGNIYRGYGYFARHDHLRGLAYLFD